MVKNNVSFILSFVILMAKMWIFWFFHGVCPTEPSNLVFSFGCLVFNGRQSLLGGIRLDDSATPNMQAESRWTDGVSADAAAGGPGLASEAAQGDAVADA